MPAASAPAPSDPAGPAATTCVCGAASLSSGERGARLASLDRAVASGQVTAAEAAERRVQLLAR